MDYKFLKINDLDWIALYCLNHCSISLLPDFFTHGLLSALQHCVSSDHGEDSTFVDSIFSFVIKINLNFSIF